MRFYIKLIIKKEKMKSAAWAVWPFIALREDLKDDKQLLRHEVWHLIQQAALLYFGWLILYGIFHLTYKYDDNPFELAAEYVATHPGEVKNPYLWWSFL